jgi:hypothetical protein
MSFIPLIAPMYGAVSASVAAIRRSAMERREYEEGLAFRRRQATKRFEQLKDEAQQSAIDQIFQHSLTPSPELMQQWEDTAYATRRPKPPSLKEQALESVKRFELGQDVMGDLDTIRRALEQLPND